MSLARLFSKIAAVVVAVLIASTAHSAAAQETLSFDAVVYDATSGGVAAAVSAARNGLRTALICASWPACFPEGGKRVGGMSSGGLGQTDLGNTSPYIGGIAREFYRRNRKHYVVDPITAVPAGGGAVNCRLPAVGCNATFNLEPHVALSIFEAMLSEAGVTVIYGSQVHTVDKVGTTIKGIMLVDDTQIVAKVWIDASYEGDLLARAGVSYTVGREARHTYNESLAGMSPGARSNQFSVAVDPFDAAGNPLPFTSLPPQGRALGSGDRFVQSYNFRLCLTTNTSNQVPFPKPANYNATDWELLRRYITACNTRGKCQTGYPSCNNAGVPNSKTDMNNCGGFASDFIGGSWDYPEASYAARKIIWTQHLEYQQGVLWTLANDKGIPATVRAEMAKTGLCADEFEANLLAPHWPPALYVRAARRLQGPRIFSQGTPEATRGKVGNLSIGIGGYNFDSHNSQRWACRNASSCYGSSPPGTPAGTAFAFDEGNVETAPGLYQIPYWVTLPKASEVGNLLVVAAPSATHIGMSTLRMEPQFMIVGHAAGTAASLAVRKGTTVQDVKAAALNAALRSEMSILDLSPQ